MPFYCLASFELAYQDGVLEGKFSWHGRSSGVGDSFGLLLIKAPTHDRMRIIVPHEAEHHAADQQAAAAGDQSPGCTLHSDVSLLMYAWITLRFFAMLTGIVVREVCSFTQASRIDVTCHILGGDEIRGGKEILDETVEG